MFLVEYHAFERNLATNPRAKVGDGRTNFNRRSLPCAEGCDTRLVPGSCAILCLVGGAHLVRCSYKHAESPFYLPSAFKFCQLPAFGNCLITYSFFHFREAYTTYIACQHSARRSNRCRSYRSVGAGNFIRDGFFIWLFAHSRSRNA